MLLLTFSFFRWHKCQVTSSLAQSLCCSAYNKATTMTMTTLRDGPINIPPSETASRILFSPYEVINSEGIFFYLNVEKAADVAIEICPFPHTCNIHNFSILCLMGIFFPFFFFFFFFFLVAFEAPFFHHCCKVSLKCNAVWERRHAAVVTVVTISCH